MWTPAQGIRLLKLTPTTHKTPVAKRRVIPEGHEANDDTTIEDQGLRLVYKGMRKTDSTIMFDLYDVISGSSVPEHFEFSMKYWESYSHSLDTGRM